MISNLELFLVISNSIIIGLLGFLYGKNTITPVRKIHPDFIDSYGNTIIDDGEEDNYNGVIIYDGDDGDEAWADT